VLFRPGKDSSIVYDPAEHRFVNTNSPALLLRRLVQHENNEIRVENGRPGFHFPPATVTPRELPQLLPGPQRKFRSASSSITRRPPRIPAVIAAGAQRERPSSVGGSSSSSSRRE